MPRHCMKSASWRNTNMTDMKKMTDINKIPDADVIAKRIFDTIKFHPLEQELISKILNEWNEEWIDYIAENKTGLHDGTKRSNDDRLKRRISKIGGASGVELIDNIGF